MIALSIVLGLSFVLGFLWLGFRIPFQGCRVIGFGFKVLKKSTLRVWKCDEFHNTNKSKQGATWPAMPNSLNFHMRNPSDPNPARARRRYAKYP